MLTKLYNFIFKHQLRKNLRIVLFKKYCVGAETDIKTSNKDIWTPQMEKGILEVLNSSTIKNLSRYTDSSLAEQIVEDRKANGPYNSLIELNNKIPHNILLKLYDLYSNDKNNIKKFRRCITPGVKGIQAPKSIVGIHVGFETISWATVTCDHKILDWDCILWPDKFGKLSTYSLANLVTNTVQQLPSSDCYVLEELYGKAKIVNTRNVQQQFIIGVMSCLKLINEQRVSDGLSEKDNVYLLKPMTTANFYKLRVGSEVIATQYIMNKLLNNIEENDTELCPMCISGETKQKFITKGSEHKEEIGWSVLKALTFVHLLQFCNTN